MTMNVREATPADRAPLARMRAVLWPDPETDHEAELADFFEASPDAREQAAFVVEHEGRLVAFAEVSIRNYAEGCETTRVGYLEGWFVEATYRRGGVGRSLVQAVEDWARARGCNEFASDAEADNETSRRAHLACGFEDLGLVRLFRKTS